MWAENAVPMGTFFVIFLIVLGGITVPVFEGIETKRSRARVSILTVYSIFVLAGGVLFSMAAVFNPIWFLPTRQIATVRNINENDTFYAGFSAFCYKLDSYIAKLPFECTPVCSDSPFLSRFTLLDVLPARGGCGWHGFAMFLFVVGALISAGICVYLIINASLSAILTELPASWWTGCVSFNDTMNYMFPEPAGVYTPPQSQTNTSFASFLSANGVKTNPKLNTEGSDDEGSSSSGGDVEAPIISFNSSSSSSFNTSHKARKPSSSALYNSSSSSSFSSSSNPSSPTSSFSDSGLARKLTIGLKQVEHLHMSVRHGKTVTLLGFVGALSSLVGLVSIYNWNKNYLFFMPYTGIYVAAAGLVLQCVGSGSLYWRLVEMHREMNSTDAIDEEDDDDEDDEAEQSELPMRRNFSSSSLQRTSGIPSRSSPLPPAVPLTGEDEEMAVTALWTGNMRLPAAGNKNYD